MNDSRLERIVSGILRAGVTLSAAVTLIGGILYLAAEGSGYTSYRKFQSQPDEHRLLPVIVSSALQGHAQPLMQLGIMILIATPVARVVFSLVGFWLERDLQYVVITAIVLAVLVYSFAAGS